MFAAENKMNLLFHLFFITLINKSIAQTCSPSQDIQRFYSNRFTLDNMFATPNNQFSDFNASFTYRTIYNYPVQLLQSTSSENINHIMAINQIEWAYNPNYTKYRLQTVENSPVSLLIEFTSSQIKWVNLEISIFVNDKKFRNGIYFDHILSDIESNKELNLIGSSQKIQKMVVLTQQLPKTNNFDHIATFITGIHSQLDSQAYFMYGINIQPKIINNRVNIEIHNKKQNVLKSIQVSFVVWTLNSAQTKYLNIASAIIELSQTTVQEQSILYRQIKEFTPLNNYLLGINGYKLIYGFNSFKISLHKSSARILSIGIGNIIQYLSVSYFSISPKANTICTKCDKDNKFIFDEESQKCIQQCSPQKDIYKYPNNQGEICLICSQKLNKTLINGQCRCKQGYKNTGDRCILNSDNQELITFSLQNNQCLEQNTIIQGQNCVCKPGYQRQNGECQYSCPGKIWNSINRQCQKCSNGQYPWPQFNQCRKCTQNCQLCLNNFQCSKCIKGFYTLSNGQCNQICGDSIVQVSECDDGNQFDGDGCSSQCKIQNGYQCDRNIPNQCVQKRIAYILIESTIISMGYKLVYNTSQLKIESFNQNELDNGIKVEFLKQANQEIYEPYSIFKSQKDINFTIIFNYAGQIPIHDQTIKIIFSLGYQQYQTVTTLKFTSDPQFYRSLSERNQELIKQKQRSRRL